MFSRKGERRETPDAGTLFLKGGVGDDLIIHMIEAAALEIGRDNYES